LESYIILVNLYLKTIKSLTLAVRIKKKEKKGAKIGSSAAADGSEKRKGAKKGISQG